MEGRFILRLMFDWGGGCLWCGNAAAHAAFDVGPVEDRLPLSPTTRQRLFDLSAWHDGGIDWDYPPDPSPWPPAEWERFEQAASEALAVVKSELGPEFEIVYVSL